MGNGERSEDDEDFTTPDEGDRERRYSAPALEKGLDILEHLSSVRTGLSLGEIAEGVARTKGQIFRMLSVLVARGYVERGPDDRYIVSDKLFRLGLNRPVYHSLIEIALPFMNSFAETTGYSCHLAVASETWMVVVARVESTTHIGFSVRIGYRQPLLRTGSGHCLLAFMSPQRRLRTLAAIAKEDPWMDMNTVSQELERFQTEGRVIRPSGATEGVIDLSAPIIDRRENGAIAALTCPFIRMRLDPLEPEDLCERLQEAAGRISALLTYN